MSKKSLPWMAAVGLALVLTGFPVLLGGHCDTLGGPVVKDGREALASGRLAPALKWVKPDRESELRRAFDLARVVRTKGPEAQELADRHFLETLVRLHRAGEGAPFTGLKDEPVAPAVALTDKALAEGSDKALVRALAGHMTSAIGEKFARALAAKKNQAASVDAGREYVEAYVALTHYVEALHAAIAAASSEHQ